MMNEGVFLDFGLYGGIITLQWQGENMKSVVFISSFLALAFPVALLAQTQPPTDQQQARQLAEQLLNGKEVIIRLYADPANKPRTFDRLAVKLEGFYVKLEAVRLAFAAGKTADAVNVSCKQLSESGQASRTTTDRLVKSAKAIVPVFEQIKNSVEVIEQATGRKFVDLSDMIDGYGRGQAIPSTWSMPGSIADSAGTAGSALDQVLQSARGDVTLDKMLLAGKTFQTAVPKIEYWSKNLGLQLKSVVGFAEAVKNKLDPNAENVGQVKDAIDRIVQLAQESAPTIEQIAKDGESLYVASKAIEPFVLVVEHALDKILEKKVIVVAPEDQTDQAVAAVVGEFIYAHPYRAGPAFSIWPRQLAPPRYQWCLFRDADKQPVAGATVEVMIGRGLWDEGVWLWIRQAKLDDKGCLKAPRPGSGGFDNFVFLVDYPEVGEVPVGPYAMELPNEQHRIYTVPALPKDKWCVFKDALGEPMPNATVEIFYESGWRSELKPTLAKLDENGKLKPPRYDPGLEYCCFIVSHPDYGTAIVEPRWAFHEDKPLQSCTVPLVHKDSQAWERSIWGVVQDVQGNPVRQAIIECHSVHTRSGVGISSTDISSSYGRFPRTITDEQGGFNFYMPIATDDHKRLVPPNAQYSVQVVAPKELSLAEYEGFAIAGEETIITMRRQRSPQELPILVFQDEFGPVTDPNRLKKVRIEIKWAASGMVMMGMGYEDWLREARFRPGTYSATADWDGKRYEFEPVEITEDSPQIVVFKIIKIEAQATVYRGQVVHGINSQPMRGVFVMVASFREGDFAQITPQQWQQIHALADNPDPCDPALEPVRAVRPLDQIVRTDSDGRFAINIKPTARPELLIAFEQDFLGVPYGLSIEMGHKSYKPNDQGFVEMPTIRLYPAAVVVIEPQIEPDVREVITRWHPGNNEDVDWLEGFLEFYRKMTTSFVINDRLRPNEPQRQQVLAGVNISLTLQPMQTSRRDCPWWCPTQTQIFRVAQGQIIDLGKVTFQREIPVYVKVVDSSGQALEDILVANGQPDGSRWSGQQQSTDQDGLARFYVPPYHQGAFLVGWHGPKTQTPWQSLAYQTTGPQDANKVFTFQLSDEVLKQLLK